MTNVTVEIVTAYETTPTMDPGQSDVAALAVTLNTVFDDVEASRFKAHVAKMTTM